MQEIDTPLRRASHPIHPLAARDTSADRSSTSSAAAATAAHDAYTPHALALLSSALLAACGGGGGDTSPVASGPIPTADVPQAPDFNNNPLAATDAQAARFLQQSQFASNTSDIAAVRSTNFAGYLQRQFALPVQQTGWDWLESKGYGDDATLNKNIYRTEIADFMVWSQLMGAPDAMRKRVSLALSEFFVVSLNSMEIDWRGYTIAAYWDILNQFAFGNFRDLLEAITLSPAMGYFLNTKGNQKEDGKGRLPDENYAREIMQLFTIGLYELNLDGSVKQDASGKSIETYDSDDVSQLARVFTGYDFDKAYAPNSTNGLPFPGGNYKVWAREYARRPMTLDATKHSLLAASFLNANIPANTPGAAALKTALDALFNHPNVGPFFGRQMIQRLVTSNPSPAYVRRVASAFNNNGAGVRGDLKAVWTAILLDDEARGAASLSNPQFGKLREPMIRLAQWARSFGAVSKQGNWKIHDLSDVSYSLGQSPLHSPSVFNFFRPGYVPPGTGFASIRATAPEFQIVNETTVGSYVNFMQSVIREGLSTEDPTTPEVVYTNYTRSDIQGDYTKLLGLINNNTSTDVEAERVSKALVSNLNLLLTAGQVSNNSLTSITAAIKAAMLQSNKLITNARTTQMETYRQDLVAAAILLFMTSPDYLIQK
jgi:uncharacterized protein (DUF1800 family)